MKKEYYNLKLKGRLLLLTLLAAFTGGVSTAWADEVTVYDGTITNANIPFDGLYIDERLYKTEFIIPSADLDAVEAGSSITKLTFYINNASHNFGGTFQVYLEETDLSALTAYSKTSTTPCYEGPLASNASSQLEIELSNSYTYNGRNLLVGIYQTAKGTYKSCNFYGKSADTYVTWTGYGTSAGSGSYFAPKTTLTCEKPVTGPGLTVFDGSTKLTSGCGYSFGLATAGTEKEFTLKNPGTESITLNIAATNGFGVTPASTTIAAGGEQTVTVTMANATADGTVTITPTASGVDPFTISVSGTIRDANKMYETFAGGEKHYDWTDESRSSYYSWSFYDGYAGFGGSSSSYSGTLTYPRSVFTAGETISFKTKRYGSSTWYTPSVSVEESADGTTWNTLATYTDDVYDTWTQRSVSVTSSDIKYVRFNGWYFFITEIYGGELPVEPKFTFAAADYDFGLVDANTTSTEFTITNDGLAPLTGVTVSSSSSTFTVSSLASTIAAGASATFTVTMSAASSGAFNGVITVSADGFDNKTFNVSGAVLPAGAMVVDFNDGLPDNWTNASWTFADGAATGKSSSAYLTTPKLTVAEGDFIVIKAKRYDSDATDYITVQGSSDNGATWSAFTKKITGSDGLSYPDYSSLVVSGIPTTVNKLRFVGYYVIVDEIAGLTYDLHDPKAVIYANAEGTGEKITAMTVTDLGWDNTGTASQTYYIKNEGVGTLTINSITADDGITVATEGNATTVPAGESLAMTIGMTSDIGPREGNISIDTDGGDFLLSVRGFVYGDKNMVDFTDAAQYTGWEMGSWSVSGDRAVVSLSSTMDTRSFTVEPGEKLYVEALGNSSTSSLSYCYSIDGGEWTGAQQLFSGSTGQRVFVISDIAGESTRVVRIRFTGAYANIMHIYGFTKAAEAIMTTTASDMAFGLLTAESAEQAFTITNDGAVTMTNLSLSLGKTGDAAEYSFRITDSEDAPFTGTTLAAGQTVTVHVKQLFDVASTGTKSDVLTIAADGQTTKTINLSGKTRDGSLLFVDFDASSDWPAEVIEHGSYWTIYNYNSSGEARQSSSSTATSLILTPVNIADASDELTFSAAYYGTAARRQLTVSYTTDGGVTWTDYNFGTAESPVTDLKSELSYSYPSTPFTITGIPAGTAVFKFNGKSLKLDNIGGNYKPTTAPLMSFTTVEDNISGQNLKADAVATYTLENKGNADYVGTVATTNVTVGVSGDDVTFEGSTLTIPAGKTATVTATMAFAAPYGDKTGAVSITSENWVGDINVDYTASLVDPTNFVEDFAANAKPAGWYSESWTYTGGEARVYTGVAKPMITEKIGAETGKNLMSFDAKVAAGTDEQELKVYSSSDRKNWELGRTYTLTSDVQTFTLNFASLTPGEYYVKFEAANAIIDNISGLKKLDLPEHDIFVTAATLPTGYPYVDSEISASATVASLIADETGVYAKLFVDGAAVATADAADIAANGTRTFTMSYTCPAEASDDHKAMIVIYNSDDTEAFTTEESIFNVVDYPALVLDETVAPDAFTAGTYNVTLNRTFVQGWNTVCLPFDVEVTAIHTGAVAYSFDDYNAETNEMNFNQVTTLSARTPYVIYVPANVTSLVFKKQAISSYTTATYAYHNPIYLNGTYAPMAAGTLTSCYGLTASGKIMGATDETTMKGYRAYFTGIPAGAGVRFVDGGMTGIRAITVENNAAEGTYNLHGQKVKNTSKSGVYIINGKKTVVK